jgi:Zn-dependent protease
MDIGQFLRSIFTSYSWFLLALTVHCWGNAWIAYRLGDVTPRLAGRLSINPLAHTSFLGSFLVPLSTSLLVRKFLPFGWGHPVKFNGDRFKRKKLYGIVCCLAGSCLNFFIGLLILFLGFTIAKNSPSLRGLCVTGAKINIAFGLFNLMPIPPLDGAHALKVAFGVKERAFTICSILGSCALIALINWPGFVYYFTSAYHFLFGLCSKFCKLLFSILPS